MGKESDDEKTVKMTKRIVGLALSALNSSNLNNWSTEPECKDYQEEIYVLAHMNSKDSMLRGLGAAFGTFALLRRRHQIVTAVKKLIRRNHYQLDPPPSAKRKSLVRRVARLGFDVSFSSFVGMGTLCWAQDTSLLSSTMASVPLVPGRSAISDELCPDIQQIANELQQDDHGMDPFVVTFMSTFARNCKLRQDYETKLRNDQGLDKNAPVKIPPPGVPMDYTMNTDNEKLIKGIRDMTDEELEELRQQVIESIAQDEEASGGDKRK